MHATIRIGIRGVASVALLASVSCTKLVELDVHYEECVRTRAPYLEEFDGGNQDLLDRCWKTENVANREFHSGEGDMVLGYSDSGLGAVPWDDAPPMLLRHFKGDFVIATKVEASNASDSGFCYLEPGDAAGIIVRDADLDGGVGARASFLVRPATIDQQTCSDEGVDPQAIAEVFMESDLMVHSTEAIGADGEADIAVCRLRGTLYYFFHHPDGTETTWGEGWKQLQAASTDVGQGPLDVGVTTTLALHGTDSDVQLQGTFNWVAVLAEGDIGECRKWLEGASEPSGD